MLWKDSSQGKSQCIKAKDGKHWGVCDIWALKWHRMRKHHATILPWKIIVMQQSCASFRNVFTNYQGESHSVYHIWARAHLERKTCDLWSDESMFQLFLKKKKRKTSLLWVKRAKTSVFDSMKVHQFPCPQNWRHMLSSRWHLFLGVCYYFSRSNHRPHFARLKTVWFINTECACVTGLPSVQICILLETYCAL